MPKTSETRRVAIVWLGVRAPSPMSESPALNVIDISGANRISRTTRSAPGIKNPFMGARDTTRPVGCSREAINTNVTNGYVKSVSKTESFGI